ncbi:GyrI-like domain-containing protein [Undibacterium flavidum]|uniref:GyrI-like domain-containing protein n=1 Tax=Undibacterium flavidum TaxID=2762297 RepID=A0ABR6YAX9_9BURK|nr:GyrI-like domain-containing protein [Undibacterium flavidum]MBC3873367.1 GyrI-like domain-containing protein [Undibacterium flavidum]
MHNPLVSRTEYLPSFSLCGHSFQMSMSQSENAVLCASFWKKFNQALTANRLAQSGHWKKYALTYSDGADYRYFCGIPAPAATPPGFQMMQIPASHYLVFEHRGSTRGIAKTLSDIYRHYLPNSHYQHERSIFIHFERYDHRFRWNHAESLIEICLPIFLDES